MSELREKLAAIEHERWSHWQQWMHRQGWPDKDGNLVIAKAQADAWSRQYHTAYADLTDSEKASDMEQVDRYWPLIEAELAAMRTQIKEQGVRICTACKAQPGVISVDEYEQMVAVCEAAEALEAAYLAKGAAIPATELRWIELNEAQEKAQDELFAAVVGWKESQGAK